KHYSASRLVDPSLCKAPLTFHDRTQLAPPADYELISDLLESFERERVKSDEQTFLRFCLSAFQRLSGKGRNIFPLIDCTKMGGQAESGLTLGREIAALLRDSPRPFALAGLRRHILDVIHD